MILCDFGYIPHCGPAFSVVRNGERLFVCTIDCFFRISEDELISSFQAITNEKGIIAEMAVRLFCRYLKSSLESIHFGEAV